MKKEYELNNYVKADFLVTRGIQRESTEILVTAKHSRLLTRRTWEDHAPLIGPLRRGAISRLKGSL